MDLPTYTSIWRIEKRLYKLYDFNLPMPLPMVQIGVFIGIFVPWVVFLQLVQVPFQQPWHVLYLVPPGLVTYLATRPVLEGKRLVELLVSQSRYLTEPRTWCRLTPAYEPARVTVGATIWRKVAHPPIAPARHAQRRVRRPAIEPAAQLDRVPHDVVPAESTAPSGPAPAAPAPAAAAETPAPAEPPAPAHPAPTVEGRDVHEYEPGPVAAPAAPSTSTSPPRPGWRRLLPGGKGDGHQEASEPQASESARSQAAVPFRGARRVVILGCSGGAGQTTATMLLGHSLALHRRDRTVAVDAHPGRHSLGHTAPTETPETLATLLPRIDSISGYLGLRAYTSQAGSGLEVIASDDDASALQAFAEQDFAAAASVLDRFYKVTLYDVAPSLAPRLLPLADQLLLVAPAGPDAQRGVETALEWLRQHGYGHLAAQSVLLLNGVRKDNIAATEQAKAAASGRCRGIVHIPADARLSPQGGVCNIASSTGSRGPAELDTLHAATRGAYLRLASSLVAGFAATPSRYRPTRDRQEVSR